MFVSSLCLSVLLFCSGWCKMSSQESSRSSNGSKLSLSLSQDTVEYIYHAVSDIADQNVWSVVHYVIYLFI